MPRPLRVDYPGAIHHVMNRGVARQPTFFTDADRIDFGAQLAAAHERSGLETIAYCLMQNHYHLLVRTPTGGLPAAMKLLGQTYTRHANDRVGRDGPIFRGRYHSITVTTDAYLLWATRYIHRNPLDVPGVDDPAAYRWSSYRAYLGHRRTPPFLNTALVLQHFGDDRRALARFTEDGSHLAIGAIETLEDLLQRTQLALGLGDLERSDDRAPSWSLRSALVVLMTRLPHGPLRDAVEQHLAFPTPEARRCAIRRAKDRNTDHGLEHAVATVLGDVARSFGV